ncbi:MAG: DNA adenine methylase [Bacteroidales bacterium]|nr:DNA adenine methylase [Bacteroidales bacterium]
MIKIKKQIKSPLNYIGGKSKFLPQLLPLFPKNIDNFIDLFCSCILDFIFASPHTIRLSQKFLRPILLFIWKIHLFFFTLY